MNTFLSLFLRLSTYTFLCAVANVHGDAPPRLDMTGQVKDSKGNPIPNAVALIVAAGQRQGSSPLCPSSYADCGKRTVTDAEGKFCIPSLDPTLDFYLEVLSPGYEPFKKYSIHPETGPVSVTLLGRNLSNVASNCISYGRIIGPDGNPVIGATLDIDGEQQGEITRWSGSDTDGMAVTDTNGEFHIFGTKPYTALYAVVEAHGLAKRWARLEPGKMILLRMNEGVSIKGRVLYRGQPLKNLKVGIDSVERECGKYLSGFRATTGEDGSFVFSDVPKDTKYTIFSVWDSFKEVGASFQREFDSGTNTVDLGVIQAAPTYHLSGRIVLADGKPIPEGTRMLLTGVDWMLVPLQTNGTFKISGVPSGEISLIPSLSGYYVSTKNPCIDENQRGVIGQINGDLSNLNILLEPGNPPSYEDIDHLPYEEQQKRKEMPLHGLPSQSDPIVTSQKK